MSMRKLLLTPEEFKWFGDAEYYFDWDEAWQTLPMLLTLFFIVAIPMSIHHFIKFLRKKGQIRGFFRRYSKFWRFLDHRVNFTRLSIIDVLMIFIWVFVSVAYIDYRDYPRQIGYHVVVNAALVLIPIYRNSFFVEIFQLPFERAVKIHRWIGRGLLLLCTAHLAGYWDRWIKTGSFGAEFAKLPNIFAHIAWFALIVLTVTSFNWFRRNYFEFFFYIHFVFPAFFVFGILHYPGMLPYMIPGLFFYVMDRLVRCVRQAPAIEDVTIESDGSVTRVSGIRKRFFNYECGSYSFVNIPALSLLEWHPCSMCSASEDPKVVFFFKSLGSWSNKLTTLNGQKAKVRIDGPYGMLSVPLEGYDVIMLCGGGIGATPMISTMREIWHHMQSGKWDAKKVYFFWTMRDPSMYYIMGDMLSDILTSDIAGFFTMAIWVTQPGANSPMFTRGRPDWPAVFRTVRDTHTDVDRIAVLSCGPSALVNSVWDCCNTETNKTTHFDYHRETFEF